MLPYNLEAAMFKGQWHASWEQLMHLGNAEATLQDFMEDLATAQSSGSSPEFDRIVAAFRKAQGDLRAMVGRDRTYINQVYPPLQEF